MNKINNQIEFDSIYNQCIFRCHFIVAQTIGVPFVYVGSHVEISVSRIPVLPSFVPHYHTKFTTEMSFSERIINLAAYMKPDLDFWQDSTLLKKYAKSSEIQEMHDLLRKSSLFLISTDHLIDSPTPSMPHLIHKRGFTLKVGEDHNLESHIEHTLDSSEKGAIVISLGTALQSYPSLIFEAIASFHPEYTLVTLDEKLIKNLTQYTKNMKDILYVSYNFRNRLLSHENIKLFITCGTNDDQIEALYHGVPILTIPFYGDQHHNARRIIQKDFGTTLDITKEKVKIDDIKSLIYDTMNNKSVIENVQKISKVMQFSCSDEWINTLEHLLVVGDRFVRSIALDLPLQHYAMLDLLAILCIFAIFTFSILSRIFMFLLRLIITKLFVMVITIVIGIIRFCFKMITLGRKTKKQ